MIKNKIQERLFIALKEKRPDEVGTLRLILSQIKNKEIDKKKELTDEEIIQLLRKMIKDLDEAITMFQKGKRYDLVEKNNYQIKIVSQFLPQEISDAQLEIEIKKIIENNKELREKNPKAFIGICIKTLKTKANTQRIIKTLNQLLH